MTIDSKTKVPLFTVLSFIVVIMGFTIRATIYLSSINAKLDAIEQHVRADWMREDQHDWVEQFKNYNPSVKIPEVDRKPKP